MDLPRNFEKEITFLNYGEVTGEVVGFAYYFDIIDTVSKKP